MICSVKLILIQSATPVECYLLDCTNNGAFKAILREIRQCYLIGIVKHDYRFKSVPLIYDADFLFRSDKKKVSAEAHFFHALS